MVLVIIDTSKHLLSPRCKNNDIRNGTFTPTLCLLICNINNSIYKDKSYTFSFLFSCVDIFCDPMGLSQISVPDVIICAPWGKQMFGCVSDHKDHSECCRRRDIPESCMVICNGKNLTASISLDYSHFRYGNLRRRKPFYFGL